MFWFLSCFQIGTQTVGIIAPRRFEGVSDGRLCQAENCLSITPENLIHSSSTGNCQKTLDTFNFLRHAMRAIWSVRPKCSHRRVSLKETFFKPVQILKHATKNSAEQTAMRTKWFKHIAIEIVQVHLLIWILAMLRCFQFPTLLMPGVWHVELFGVNNCSGFVRNRAFCNSRRRPQNPLCQNIDEVETWETPQQWHNFMCCRVVCLFVRVVRRFPMEPFLETSWGPISAY